MDINVVSFRLLDHRWTPGGRRVVADFTVEMAGIRFAACHLIECRDGRLVAYLPRGKGDGLHFTDHVLHAAFQARAVATFGHFERNGTADEPKGGQ